MTSYAAWERVELMLVALCHDGFEQATGRRLNEVIVLLGAKARKLSTQ